MSLSGITKKRFIAGAACPSCRALDTTYTLQKEESISRHCVECNFSEVLKGEEIQVISLPDTRKS